MSKACTLTLAALRRKLGQNQDFIEKSLKIGKNA
jgi:hypothetical protein